MNIFGRTTRKTLWKNKTRTIVTIIGIMLSAAMITAVLTSIVSLQEYALNCAVYQDGNWHISQENLTQEELSQVREDEDVDSGAAAQELGYAPVENKWAEKPYLYVLGADGLFMERMPVHLIRGRLPENSSELLIPNEIVERGQAEIYVGDQLTLDLGDRMLGGETLYQHNPLMLDETGELRETLQIRQARTYTVVGVYETPGFEDYSSPGQTALTCWDDSSAAETYSVYLLLKDPGKAYSYMNGSMYTGTANTDVLLYSGVSFYDTFYKVLYNLAAILIGLTIFGSVSLIYNAFSISVSERTRQFGLFSSVGATRRQLRNMVFDEAVYLSLIGVPLGILCGVAGIGVTLNLIGNKFYSLFGVGQVAFRLKISPFALAAAAVLAFITVLVSAWIPSRRAARVSAIEAIRQTGDIKAGGKVKTSRIVYRLFGLEGMIAAKHFKRDKKRYRATIISLFMSVVIFISASSFCTYLTDAVTGTFQVHDYDISYSVPQDLKDSQGNPVSAGQAAALLSRAEGVTRSSFAAAAIEEDLEIPPEWMPESTRKYFEGTGTGGVETEGAEGFQAGLMIYGVDEVTYRGYLKELGLPEETYMDAEHPLGVGYSWLRDFNRGTERVESLQLLDQERKSLPFWHLNRAKFEQMLEQGNTGDMTEEEYEQRRRSCLESRTLEIGTYADRLPFGLNRSKNHSICIVYPISAFEKLNLGSTSATIYFEAADHSLVFQNMAEEAGKNGLPREYLYDVYAVNENDRNLVLIIKVFSYGFIVLISLIALANVFNTISTSIYLRRREFAMLKSVGMTRKGFRKMMNFECLLYGLKALAFGIPISFAVTWLIFRSVRMGYDTGFYLPWPAVAVAVGSVFLVVFATMMYSMRKISSDNPIDALKDENQ